MPPVLDRRLQVPGRPPRAARTLSAANAALKARDAPPRKVAGLTPVSNHYLLHQIDRKYMLSQKAKYALKAMIALAEAEGLPAHARSAAIRLGQKPPLIR